jgi:hypothetical protein
MYSSYPKGEYAPFEIRPYNGPSPHRTHAHLSVVSDSRGEQTHPWILEDDVPQFTPEEEAQLRALLEHADNLVGIGRGLEAKDSSGWGLATNGVDLIRKERATPLHDPPAPISDVLKRGDIVQLGNPPSG